MADESSPPMGEPGAHTDTRDQNTTSTDTQNILNPKDGVTDRDCAPESTAGVLDPSTVPTQEVAEFGRDDGVDEVMQQVEDMCIGGGGDEQWGGEGGGDGVMEGVGQGEDETVQEKPHRIDTDLTEVEDTTPQDPVKGLHVVYKSMCFSTATSVHIQ